MDLFVVIWMEFPAFLVSKSYFFVKFVDFLTLVGTPKALGWPSGRQLGKWRSPDTLFDDFYRVWEPFWTPFGLLWPPFSLLFGR